MKALPILATLALAGCAEEPEQRTVYYTSSGSAEPMQRLERGIRYTPGHNVEGDAQLSAEIDAANR